MRVLPLVLTSGAVLCGAVLAAVTAPTPATPTWRAPNQLYEYAWLHGPPPTENRLDEAYEKSNKSRRKAWFREMHKAAEDVDPKEIERANGEAQIAKRNALAIAPPPGPQPVWVERGSDNQAGRMHVAVHSLDHSTLYAGSALGGLWRANRDGEGWTPLGDNLYGGAHFLLALPDDTLLVSTSWAYVHWTDDDGATWNQPTGLEWAHYTRRMVATSDGTDTVLLVQSRYNGAAFVYRSTDGGRSFSRIVDLGPFHGDLWTPRDGSSHRLYLASSDGIEVSHDLGDSWSLVGPLPREAKQAELVGSEAGRLWLVLDDRYLYRSDDDGSTWQPVREVDDYWSELNASITDPDVFMWGGVEAHRTTNGGESFRTVNAWWDYYGDPDGKLHADIQGIDVMLDESGDEIWYISTDGGLYRSDDLVQSVENLALRGLRVSQYYDVLTSSANPDHIAVGAQDQGYQVTNGVPQDGDVQTFDQVISGDYGHLTSGDGSHGYVFSVYPGFILVQIGENNPMLADASYPAGLQDAAWLPPVVADPTDPASFYFCGDRVWRYTFDGGSWTPSPHGDEQFGPGYVSALAIAPSDPDRWYAATNYGRLYTSTDGGLTWDQSDDAAMDPHYFYGHALVVDPSDPDIAVIGGSGYSTTGVLRTTDGGRSWQRFDQGLPDTLVYSLAASPSGDVWVAGTEQAAYRRDADDDAWTDITAASAPVTIYWAVEALAHEPTFRFATYGRGLWDYQLEDGAAECWPPGDADGDGVDCAEDCNDADAAVFPGAPEECDGIDNNCDPDDLDEQDADDDGVPACDDCDDSDPDVAAACDGDDDPEDIGGCTCTTGGAGAWVWLLALAVLARRDTPRT